MNAENKMTVAVVPGSFDPLTLGHRDVIVRCAALFDRVVVGILINPDKHGLFTMDERKIIAQLTLADIPNVSVEIDSGYLTDFAERMGASVIVKGVRTAADFEYEQKMAYFNRARNPKIETLYLPADESMTEISSTVVREKMSREEDLTGLLHPDVIAWLKDRKNGE
jgi:pantetheine-phosphate adenylyltransferase